MKIFSWYSTRFDIMHQACRYSDAILFCFCILHRSKMHPTTNLQLIPLPRCPRMSHEDNCWDTAGRSGCLGHNITLRCVLYDTYSPIPVDLSQQGRNIPVALDSKKSQHPGPVKVRQKNGTDEKDRQKHSRPYVDHTYVDFSSVDDERVCMNSRRLIHGETMQSIMDKGGVSEPKDIVILQTRITNRSVEIFPTKLMDLLLQADACDCITWLPHGRSFRVLDSDLFMKKFSPQTFRATLYRSFERQLNIWGFKRFTCGVDFNSYYHPMFLRGKPNLAMNMTRKKCKLGCKPIPSPGEEPDFYALSILRPLA